MGLQPLPPPRQDKKTLTQERYALLKRLDDALGNTHGNPRDLFSTITILFAVGFYILNNFYKVVQEKIVLRVLSFVYH